MSFSNTRQKILIWLILLILLIDCSIFVSGNHQSQSKPTLLPHHTYEPQDINLEDAAFHKSSGRYHGEWWYFEGIFDNGYSVVLRIITLSKGCRGRCSLGINIYNDTELEFCLNEDVSIKDVEASEDFPLITVSGERIMRLDMQRYNTTGEWMYYVSLEIDGQSVQLQFLGKTKGYKGEILRGWYGPVLPKATVNGTLLLNGETISVNGSGYHEHGWSITIPIWEWGWYWGKIESDSFSVPWAKMMKTPWRKQTQYAVLNQNQLDYITINPENIKIKVTKYRFDHWRMIPTKFILNMTDPENSIYINATMETINIHHTGKRLIHYWRYHVLVNGQITCGSTTEIIKDKVQIIEFMRLR